MTKLAEATEEVINMVERGKMYTISGQTLVEWMFEARLSAKREACLKELNKIQVETILQLRIAAGTAKKD